MHISKFYLWEEIHEYNEMYSIFYERIGKFPDRIANLYYLYVFLMDVVIDISDTLPKYTYDTTSRIRNEGIQEQMLWLSHYIKQFPDPTLIEQDLLSKASKQELTEEMLPTFKNITDVLECVGCNVCKLNAKVQFMGLATTLKILFTEHNQTLVTENELIGLFNLMFRISNSISWYESYCNDEDVENFTRFIIFGVLMLCLAIIFIIAVILLFYTPKGEEEEDEKPLRKSPQPS